MENNSIRVTFPVLPLPSAELCLLSTQPISCLRERKIDRLARLRAFQDLESDQKSELDIKCTDELAEEYVPHKPLSQLIREERSIKSLLRYLELGICNKKQIVAIHGLDFGSMADGFAGFQKLHESGMSNSLLASLIRAILTSNYVSKCPISIEITKEGVKNSNLSSILENSLICLDDTPFSVINTANDPFPQNLLSNQRKQPKIDSEDTMFENLCKGLLCDGGKSKSAKDLAFSFIFGNNFECLSPRFLGPIMRDRRIIKAISSANNKEET